MPQTLSLPDDVIAQLEIALDSMQMDDLKREALRYHFHNVVIPEGEPIGLSHLCMLVAAMYNTSIREALRCLSEGYRKGKVKVSLVQ